VALTAAGPRRVLVVDDEPLVLRSVQRVLGRTYVVLTAASAEEALALLERGEAIEAVFTDLSLPGMDGAELARRIAERWPALAGKTVFMSGGATNEAHHELLARSDVRRVDKPFDLAALRRLASELLGP
jgi:CheY-like chemotaxis protein